MLEVFPPIQELASSCESVIMENQHKNNFGQEGCLIEKMHH
jgi:hypothetical protein